MMKVLNILSVWFNPSYYVRELKATTKISPMIRRASQYFVSKFPCYEINLLAQFFILHFSTFKGYTWI